MTQIDSGAGHLLSTSFMNEATAKWTHKKFPDYKCKDTNHDFQIEIFNVNIVHFGKSRRLEDNRRLQHLIVLFASSCITMHICTI